MFSEIKSGANVAGNTSKSLESPARLKIVDVDRRRVYNYIKKKKVYAVKVAGNTIRVCSQCLLRENQEERTNGSTA